MKRRILIISPQQKLITGFITNNNFKIPSNLSFYQMRLTSKDPDEFKIKNIHNILLSLDNLNTYSGIIMIFPKNNTIQNNSEDYERLNDRLRNAGIKFGAVLMILNPDGILTASAMRQNFESYLYEVSKF